MRLLVLWAKLASTCPISRRGDGTFGHFVLVVYNVIIRVALAEIFRLHLVVVINLGSRL